VLFPSYLLRRSITLEKNFLSDQIEPFAEELGTTLIVKPGFLSVLEKNGATPRLLVPVIANF
jgi:hypothetical protein